MPPTIRRTTSEGKVKGKRKVKGLKGKEGGPGTPNNDFPITENSARNKKKSRSENLKHQRGGKKGKKKRADVRNKGLISNRRTMMQTWGEGIKKKLRISFKGQRRDEKRGN